MHAYNLVRTTVALDSEVRDRLVGLKQRWGLASVEDVLTRLLDGAPQSAAALYQARRREVDAVLKRHSISKLIAFGSRARGDARPDSDLDLAAALPRGVDLFDVVHIREDLEEAFGVRVDVVSLVNLRPRLKAQVAKEGVVLFERQG